MAVPRVRPLPGIRFIAEPAAVPTPLPRMDVAAFVGFAQRGPLHVPVAVEDPERFREVFGGDRVLAWDGENRRLQHSLLGQSVELFFRNGGRRCRVVRVAAQQQAKTQSFVIPGLYRAEGVPKPPRMLARSPGAWADGLRVGARLVSRPLAGLAFAGGGSGYRLDLGASPVTPAMGDLIELRSLDVRLYLYATRLENRSGGLLVHADRGYWFRAAAGIGSPEPEDLPGGLEAVGEREGLARLHGMGSPAPEATARLLRMELLAWTGERLDARFDELGLDPRHARYFGNLPDDAALYRRLLELSEGALGLDLPELWREANEPRFPLAGTGEAERYLPLGLPTRLSPQDAIAGERFLGASGLVAEGLAEFGAHLFLDPDLAGQGSATLAAEAKHKQFVRREPLLGLHSLWSIEEVSLIAVPDAVHRHWDRRVRSGDALLPAPWLEVPEPPDARDRRLIHWSAVGGVRQYWVEQAETPDFDQSRRYLVDRPDPLALADAGPASPEPVDEPPTRLRVRLAEDCGGTFYFRVRAVGYGWLSAWSNTQVLRVPEGGFRDCARAEPASLMLRLHLEVGAMPGQRRLAWDAVLPTGLDAGATGFELQRGREADFLSPDVMAAGVSPVDVPLPADARAYYRARALAADGPGPWSNTVVVEPLELSADSLEPREEYDGDDLLAVHSALVRLAAERADSLAQLSLPAHFREPEVTAHLDALFPASGGARWFGRVAPQVPGLEDDDAPALSHAALFHPWVLRAVSSPDGRRAVRPMPPDGAVLGAIAAVSRSRGAWISPANQPLADVLGLAPAFSDAAAKVLLGGPVNLLRKGPRGNVVVRTDTLSLVAELQPLTVRRFLHLLRRLVEREAPRYVFEPNGDDLRDAVRAQWQHLLLDLYARGALRGRSPDTAFRVVLASADQGARPSELGQLVVELQVAPALPLQFMTVRLIQAGLDGLRVEEV